MIPRYQRILYWLLLALILLMSLLLVRGCRHSVQRIAGARDQSPIPAPTDTSAEPASIASPSDDDGTIALDQVSLALPQNPSLRARALLERMFADLSSPGSQHPVPAGPALIDVFLVPLPLEPAGANPPSPSTTAYGLGDPPRTGRRLEQGRRAPASSPYGLSHSSGAQLAVVNLTSAFADAHPSGIESEELTLQAILATLQANLPQIEEVLFLVDGHTRETLHGHADLTRPYPVVEPTRMIHVLSADGNPI